MAEVARKLLINAGHRVGPGNPPAGYIDRLQPLPEGASVVKSTTAAADVLPVFVHNTADLHKLDPKVFQRVKPDGVLWVC
jgi:predicted methyltransferase